jgi:hypothetical protein
MSVLSRANELAASSLTRLGTDTSSRPNHLGSSIISMTQHRHHATPKLPRQRYCQYDSLMTLCHDQRHLSYYPSGDLNLPKNSYISCVIIVLLIYFLCYHRSFNLTITPYKIIIIHTTLRPHVGETHRRVLKPTSTEAYPEKLELEIGRTKQHLH